MLPFFPHPTERRKRAASVSQISGFLASLFFTVGIYSGAIFDSTTTASGQQAEKKS